MSATATEPIAPGATTADALLARGAAGLLRAFNQAGVLSAADVHVAARLGELAGEPGEDVRLAAALAVRAPRQGHVFVDLATIQATAAVETEEPVDLAALPWPAAGPWLTAVAGSQLVAVGDDDPAADQPLRLLGSRLYLDRYWREERSVAVDLRALATEAGFVSEPALAGQLERLAGEQLDQRQLEAAAAAARRRLAVVAGGPGTGKTTTVAAIVALLAAERAARGLAAPLVALAAPTGKAAARLEEAVHEEAGRLSVGEPTRALLGRLRASTLHRLLGSRPDSHSRFAHHRGNRLPHDVVIVDETSMVSLWLMGRLVEAVRPDARLILVGDPGQLSSIEAGVVLADIVGPAAERGAATRERPAGAPARPGPAGVGAGIVVLERVHRYGGAIATVADAIRAGDPDATVQALRRSPEGVTWLALASDDAGFSESELGLLRSRAVAAARVMTLAARDGLSSDALDALARFRLLCAHRRGPYGVSHWTARVQAWLSAELGDLDLDQRDYVGRPLLVTENDYELGLYNGDTGVVVQDGPESTSAVFLRGAELLRTSPLRLGAVETAYAMTIHKSQGSQFDTAAVLLPPPGSRILTRELLYTAATRARGELILVGSEQAIRSAVQRPVARASGLRERLWSA
jgi:exodeoxyribonuclease V alpha subunit